MNEEQTQQADDPSGPGWRDVGPDEILQTGDMFAVGDHWEATQNVGTKAFRYGIGYRRRIEPEQPSDSEPEAMQQLRERVATLHSLAEMSRRQVEDEARKVEQLKDRVQGLTRELSDAVEARQKAEHELATETKRYRVSFQDRYRDGQQRTAEALQTWLRPVLELVAEHPEDCSSLAVAVLGYLPGIASRLIEE